MTYEPGVERGTMWEDESGGDSGESGLRRRSSLEAEKREEEEGERGDVKKKGSHFKKSSQSDSVIGAHRSVKKYSENDFDRTNLILTSEKGTGKVSGRGKSDLPRLWASLSICWGSNAQVKRLFMLAP